MTKSYFIKTFGCLMNTSDSERLKAVLEECDMTESAEMADADVILFNTCQVRQSAEDRLFGQNKNLSKLRKKKPHLLVGVLGCITRKTSTRLDPKTDQDEILRRMDAVDFVFKTEDLTQLDALMRQFDPELERANEYDDYLTIKPDVRNPRQALIAISNGCNKFCTYCTVPFSRGKERHRPAKDILEEVRTMAEKGAFEFTLLGQTVNSYVSPCGMDFAELLRQVSAVPGVFWLRFTSPYPTEMTREVVEVIAEKDNICNVIHAPIQSGDDTILRAMNRRYTTAEYLNVIKMFREVIPDVAITTDIIVGFPGETDEQFENSVRLYETVQFDHCFHAKYSPRKRTAAFYKEDDVPFEVKEQRWKRLNEVIGQASFERNQRFMGRKMAVFVTEKLKNGLYRGKDEFWHQIRVSGENLALNTMYEVEIEECLMWELRGRAHAEIVINKSKTPSFAN